MYFSISGTGEVSLKVCRHSRYLNNNFQASAGTGRTSPANELAMHHNVRATRARRAAVCPHSLENYTLIVLHNPRLGRAAKVREPAGRLTPRSGPGLTQAAAQGSLLRPARLPLAREGRTLFLLGMSSQGLALSLSQGPWLRGCWGAPHAGTLEVHRVRLASRPPFPQGEDGT